jgi:hypothetical protein
MLKARLFASAVLVLGAVAASAHDTNTTNPQKKAVEEFLGAVATGNPQTIAFAIHPDELEALRTRILTQLRAEAERGESTVRTRLFGSAMPLSEIERLTIISFYATLGRKLTLAGREYNDYKYLAAVPDVGERVQVIVRALLPKVRGESDRVGVVHVVSIKPYGKDWKAVVPDEITAQIDDLAHARRPVTRVAGIPPDQGAGRRPASTGPSPSTPPAGDSATPTALRERLAAAEKALADAKCEEYYKEHMSPNFRRIIAKKALEALIASCEKNFGNREMLLSTLRIVQALEPRFEYDAQRAVYDVSGNGLPFDRFALEQVDRKWYIAE